MEEMEGRIIAQDERTEDTWQYSLRPRKLDEYIGQKKAKENLKVFVQAALNRSTGRPVSARRRSRASSPTSWA